MLVFVVFTRSVEPEQALQIEKKKHKTHQQPCFPSTQKTNPDFTCIQEFRIWFLSRSTNHNVGHYWVQLPQKPSRSVISGYIGLFRGGMMCPRVPIFFRILLAFLNKKKQNFVFHKGATKMAHVSKGFWKSLKYGVCLFVSHGKHTSQRSNPAPLDYVAVAKLCSTCSLASVFPGIHWRRETLPDVVAIGKKKTAKIFPWFFWWQFW